MKYIFLDIECASVYNGAKICSLGYVLTDEDLNIIEQEDIMINPQSTWDWYTLKNILVHPREYYESFPSFDRQYKKIKSLFEGDVIVLGHGITNDVRFLNQDCKRYNLPSIDFIFYDCAAIYKEFLKEKEIKSLKKVSIEIGNRAQGEKHESLNDALLVYEYIKEICKYLEVSITDLLSLTQNCKGENLRGICKYRNINKNKTQKKKNSGKLYECFIENVKPNQECNDKFLNDKKIAISYEYERKHFKEMLLIIQLIANYGGEYVRNPTLANLYVTDLNNTYSYDIREIQIDELIDEGKKINKVTLNEFFKQINFDVNQVEDNYKEVCETIIKIIKDEEKSNLNIVASTKARTK